MPSTNLVIGQFLRSRLFWFPAFPAAHRIEVQAEIAFRAGAGCLRASEKQPFEH